MDQSGTRTALGLVSGICSVFFSTIYLTILENRASTVRDLVLSGGFLYLLITAIQTWRSGGRVRSYFRQVFAPGWVVVFLFLVAMSTAAINSTGYGQRPIVGIVRFLFYSFVILMTMRKRFSAANIALFPLLAVLLLPLNGAFFAWSGFLFPPVVFFYAYWVWGLHREQHADEPIRQMHAIDLSVLGFVLLYVCLLPFARSYQEAVMRLVFYAILLLVYFIIRFHYTGPEGLQKIGTWMQSIGSLYSILFVTLILLSFAFPEIGWEFGKGPKGKMLTTHVAPHFIFFACLAFVLMRPGLTVRRRWMYGLLGGVNILALVFSMARGSILALLLAIVVVTVTVLFVRRLERRTLVRMTVVLSAMLLIYALLVILVVDMSILTQFSTIQERMVLWHHAWKIILEYPYTGTGDFTGFHLFRELADPPYLELSHRHATNVAPWIAPHNLYLALLISGGVPAFISFWVIMGLLAHQTLRMLREQNAPISSSALAVLLCAWPLIGLGESLIAVYIPAFLLWLTWALAGARFAVQMRAFSFDARVTKTARLWPWLVLPLMGALMFAWSFYYRASVPVAHRQSRVTGILMLEQGAPRYIPNEKEDRLAQGLSYLSAAAVLAPLDWRIPQLQGEITYFMNPEDVPTLRAAINYYEHAVRLNQDLPLLWLRMGEF
ncbi:MAG: O-antigen ligase family protein, partial [Leptospiraceae bacterium]|nr:O-antigen ligase family protein [Leptospiraceae bacterium]